MVDINHSKGFEREAKLSEIYMKVRGVNKSLSKWNDFIDVARIINPELCEAAFVTRPCIRKLRYIGEGHKYFVPGTIYQSIGFSGATYSIEGYSDVNGGRVIGSAYFEVV